MANGNSKDSGAKSGAGKTTGRIKGVNLVGTEGGEALVGGEGNDVLDGRGGNDLLLGAGGNDYLIGRDGDDRLDGGANYDQMDGGAGNDTYVVDHGGDLIVERAGEGVDTVLSSVSYALNLELEHLALTGNGSIDGIGNYRDNQLTGNAAANRLDGREGNDAIDGGQGADVLTGGLGADVFAFTAPLGAGNVDAILDFAPGVDRIALDDATFAGLAPGVLPIEAFRVGAAAEDADDRILYDPATGTLSFDADGIGGLDAVAFATVQPALAIAASDFAVI
ncbi:MAG TPA: calcium-binding protein [Allosphingosinicella sp.]|nr:calcium-binding protein [Allosphingosinicella sp.]